jgi:hypothetical protein
MVMCAALSGCADDKDAGTTDLLAYHVGYWVTVIEVAELTSPITVINDMHNPDISTM